jgi:hypothetical protein
MFKSIEYLRKNDGIYTYRIIDSDFECDMLLDIDTVRAAMNRTKSMGGATWSTILEYDKQNLPIGRNLSLITIYFSNEFKHSISYAISWQDAFMPEYLKQIDYANYKEKWEQWKKERDEYLVML